MSVLLKTRVLRPLSVVPLEALDSSAVQQVQCNRGGCDQVRQMPVEREIQSVGDAVHSCAFPLALLCPMPRASPAMSCARVWLHGSTALALGECQCHQATVSSWLCCTCTGFTDFFNYFLNFLLHSRRDSLRQSWLEWRPALAAGFWFRGVVRWSYVSCNTTVISRPDLSALSVCAVHFMYK